MVKYVSWEFYLCVCGLNLGSFQIQTFPFLFHLFPSFQLRRAEFLFPVQPSWPNQQCVPAHQPSIEPATPFSRRQTGPACRSTFYSLPCFPHLRSAPHQASRAAAARARDGTLSPFGRPARRGTGARSRASRIWPGREIPLLPCATHLCILACTKGERRCLGHPGGQSRGSLGFSPRRLRCQGSKAREEAETQTSKLPTPLGFSLSSSPERAP
jgi:hypothetical protein